MKNFVVKSMIFVALTSGVVLKADDYYPPIPDLGSKKPPKTGVITTVVSDLLAILGIYL